MVCRSIFIFFVIGLQTFYEYDLDCLDFAMVLHASK